MINDYTNREILNLFLTEKTRKNSASESLYFSNYCLAVE